MTKGWYSDGATEAFEKFCDLVIKQTGCTKKAATKVAELYLKNKLAKIDHISRQMTVRHGAFLDKEVLERAIEMAA